VAAIRELLVAFEIDVKDSDLGRTAKKLDTLGSKFKAVASAAALFFGARALGGFIQGTAAAAAAAGDLAQQVGITAESFQILNFAAKLTGATTEDLRISLKSLAKNAQSVVDGSATMVKAFKDLGVEVTDTNDELKSNDELLLEVGAALSAIENPTERVAKAQTVLGEASLKLLPLLSGTREELDAYLDSLRDLGGGFSTEAIEASRRFQAALGKLQFFLQGVAGDIIIKLTPAIEGFVDFVIQVSQAIGDTVRSIKEFFGQTKALRNLLGVGLFGAIKKLLPIVGRFARLLLINPAQVFKPFVGVLFRIGRLLAIGARFARRFILPFLIFDDILTFFEGGDSLIGRFIDRIAGAGTAKKFQDAIKAFIKGISSFLTFFFSDDPEERAKAEKQMQEAFAKAAGLFKDFFFAIGQAIVNFLVETDELFQEAFKFVVKDLLIIFIEWFNEVKEKLGKAWDILLNSNFVKVLKGFLDSITQTFVTAFDNMWADITKGAKRASAQVQSFIPEGLGDFLGIDTGESRGNVNAGSTGGTSVQQRINVQQQINAGARQSPAAIAAAANRQQGAVLEAANLRSLRGSTQN